MLRKSLAACEFDFALQFSFFQLNAHSNYFVGLGRWGDHGDFATIN